MIFQLMTLCVAAGVYFLLPPFPLLKPLLPANLLLLAKVYNCSTFTSCVFEVQDPISDSSFGWLQRKELVTHQ